MKASLRRRIETRWYDNSGPFLLLLPLSWLFALLSALRRGLFRSGLLRAPALPVPVIVVGNISVGGTGKTPIAVWLVKQLIDRGHRPGIVSRGYGGESARQPRLVTDKDAKAYGDEPVLLAALTGCPVCVCGDRVAAVRLVAQEGVTVVISDDGLQHYRMRRVAEFVVVDGERGFGNGHLLPAGPLREPVSRAYASDAMLINGQSDQLTGIPFTLEQRDAVNLATGASRPLSAFAGQRVWGVAGIGNPGRFYRQLAKAGLQIDEVPVPDHGSVSIEGLLRQKDQPVVMTEKDAVKYPDVSAENIWCVPVIAVCAPADCEKIMALVRNRLEEAESCSIDAV